MKSVLSKIAKIESRKVELANMGDLEDSMSKTMEQVNLFMDIYGQLETLGLKLGGPGIKAIELWDATKKIANEIEAKMKDLGLDPNDSPQYMMYDDYKQEIEADIERIDASLNDLENLVNI